MEVTCDLYTFLIALEGGEMTTSLLKLFGTNLTRARQRKRMSRYALSTFLGISEADVEAIENGNRDVDLAMLHLMALTLDMPVIQLLSA